MPEALVLVSILETISVSGLHVSRHVPVLPAPISSPSSLSSTYNARPGHHHPCHMIPLALGVLNLCHPSPPGPRPWSMMSFVKLFMYFSR